VYIYTTRLIHFLTGVINTYLTHTQIDRRTETNKKAEKEREDKTYDNETRPLRQHSVACRHTPVSCQCTDDCLDT